MNPNKAERKIAGILAGAYTCTTCNSPSAAAIMHQGQYKPACTKHGKGAESLGQRVIWKMPTA